MVSDNAESISTPTVNPSTNEELAEECRDEALQSMRSLRYWQRGSGAYNSQIRKIVRLLHRAERQRSDWTPRLATHHILVWLTAQLEVADSVRSDVRTELDRYSAQYTGGPTAQRAAAHTAMERTIRVARQGYEHLSSFCCETYPRAVARIIPASFMQRFISPDYWIWICWAWTAVLLTLLLRLAVGHPLLFYSSSSAYQRPYSSPTAHRPTGSRTTPSPTRMSYTPSSFVMLGPFVLFGDNPMASGYDFFVHLLLFLGPFLLLRYLNRRLQFRQ
ncbi:hypothetical protein Pmar_PMAR010167 [Perkinsus marinus ATCC 50983]|uniref:Uncharacterized protein n=1 Tax=Perkinsus marinus (strain ATCC 50983 / TXsc) TaxID=423536 RepID=C5K506_PERM5|nr:hypothetical protein Pmar_PMAR010167 [Perkinsus marinus ATCC 50983]EER20428.1 hypothetical protein Pmar_PMAR010167 [Perkinsus marinus ATCC 50983]|eukprot:XP_002788632.1 hypothetical protein Pmar_PMAR010167 [Perkinsus marinus ATCC 50983]